MRLRLPSILAGLAAVVLAASVPAAADGPLRAVRGADGTISIIGRGTASNPFPGQTASAGVQTPGPAAAPARPAGLSASPDAGACLAHLDAAERGTGIPKGLLRAVALVESEYGGVPWPWTLNISGKDVRFPDKASAVRAMIGPGGAMRSSMAVGCMQIYVRWHGERFSSASQMIDPRVNVWYAARYLAELRGRYGSWVDATAHYHSSERRYQIQYLCRVVAKRVAGGYQVPNDWFKRSCAGTKIERAAGGWDFAPVPGPSSAPAPGKEDPRAETPGPEASADVPQPVPLASDAEKAAGDEREEIAAAGSAPPAAPPPLPFKADGSPADDAGSPIRLPEAAGPVDFGIPKEDVWSKSDWPSLEAPLEAVLAEAAPMDVLPASRPSQPPSVRIGTAARPSVVVTRSGGIYINARP